MHVVVFEFEGHFAFFVGLSAQPIARLFVLQQMLLGLLPIGHALVTKTARESENPFGHMARKEMGYPIFGGLEFLATRETGRISRYSNHLKILQSNQRK